MPTYRRASCLQHTLPQILNQTYTDFELVICDDASPDNTSEVVNTFDDPRIRYYRNAHNLNIPANVNRILELATGQLIIMLHDHDSFHPRLLEKMVTLYDRWPNLGFVHPGVAWVESDGSGYRELLCDFKEITPGQQLVSEMLMGDDFSCPVTACAMVSRSSYEQAGFRYDEQFSFLSDMDRWLRLAMRFDVGYIREALITCRARDDNHEYAGVDWRLIRWAVAIHDANIERAFPAHHPVRSAARARFERKRRQCFAQATLAAAARGNTRAFREGLALLSRERGGSTVHLARSLSAVRFIHPTITGVARVLNYLRKTMVRQ